MSDKIQVGRRALLQTLAGSAASAFALPALASGHPMTEHLHDQAKVARADTKARATNWKPAFLDQHQIETVRVLAEKIVPGSTTAKSAEFIDALLAVDTEQNQRRFLSALGAFEGLAIAQAKQPWKSLSDADQIALLTKASTAESGAYYSSEAGMKELGWTGTVMHEKFAGCEHGTH